MGGWVSRHGWVRGEKALLYCAYMYMCMQLHILLISVTAYFYVTSPPWVKNKRQQKTPNKTIDHKKEEAKGCAK